MTTAKSTPQFSTEGKSKERKIYPMTDEIYERGEEVFWARVRELEAKRAQQAAQQQEG